MPRFAAKLKAVGSPPAVRKVEHDLIGGAFVPPPAARTWFKSVTVENISFAGARFHEFVSEGTQFIRCSFSKARFDAGWLAISQTSRFVDCSFEGADLRQIDPGLARFERCIFDRSRIEGWISTLAEFENCRFATTLKHCVFLGQPFGAGADAVLKWRSVNEFRGNDFSSAVLIDVAFKKGIDISAQKWPPGPEYLRLDRLPDRVRAARAVVSNWTDAKEREDALLILGILSSDGYEVQEELFARPDEISSSRGAVRLWEFLRHDSTAQGRR